MGIAEVQTEILQPMQQIYLPPRDMPKEAQAGALQGYAVALQDFAVVDLREGWKEVVASTTTRGWPVPGVIVLACRKARKERGANDNSAEHGGRGDFQAPSFTELRLRWDAVKKTQLARDAVRDGCAWSLKCAIFSGQKPEQIDLRELVVQCMSAQRTAKKIERGEPVEYRGRTLPPLQGSKKEMALAMYATVREREADTVREIGQ